MKTKTMIIEAILFITVICSMWFFKIGYNLTVSDGLTVGDIGAVLMGVCIVRFFDSAVTAMRMIYREITR